MSVQLVLLGFLNKSPMYGYELKQKIEEIMGDWTNIAFGSIYFALNKLNEKGYIIKAREEKTENRPQRIIYSITEKGREKFQKLLLREWERPYRDYYPFDIALFFIDKMPLDEIDKLLEKRIKKAEDALKYLDEHEMENRKDSNIPEIGHMILDHTREHTKAELQWLKKLREKL
jgi:DNA-binding PadR family transcriptional regulator